jgi:hypothetical protein
MPANVGAVDDRHESAHPGDEEGDDATCDGRGDQYPQPVPVREQAHRNGAEHGQPRGERNDDGDDRGGRRQGGHDGGVGELSRLQRTGMARFPLAVHTHFTILPVVSEEPSQKPVSMDTVRLLGLHRISM